MHRPLKIGSTSSAKLMGSAAQTSFGDAAIARASIVAAAAAVVTVAGRGLVFMTGPFVSDTSLSSHLNGNVGRALIRIKVHRCQATDRSAREHRTGRRCRRPSFFDAGQ